MALNETLTGEVCHIKGARSGSARYDCDQTDAERHAYANLILMCPTHHTVIDDDEETYTVERLIEIKATHEADATPISDAEAAAVAELFENSNITVGQTGGLSAHTVNATTITVQSAPSTSHLTHQRQIQAVEHLWKVVRNLRGEFSHVVFIDNILTAQELHAYFSHGEYAHIVGCLLDYADMNVALRKFSSAGADGAASERLFVTHRLWSVFFVLQGIYGRTALLITNSYKERRYVDWHADSGCDQLLRAILPVHAVEDAKRRTIGGLQTAIDYLESQFLAEAGMNDAAK